MDVLYASDDRRSSLAVRQKRMPVVGPEQRVGGVDAWHPGAVALEQPPPLDEDLVALLTRRDGLASDVILRDGGRLTVFNIAWGYDIGDQFAHVTTNISPDVAGAAIDFFATDSVAAVIDPETSAVLYERS